MAEIVAKKIFKCVRNSRISYNFEQVLRRRAYWGAWSGRWRWYLYSSTFLLRQKSKLLQHFSSIHAPAAEATGTVSEFRCWSHTIADSDEVSSSRFTAALEQASTTFNVPLTSKSIISGCNCREQKKNLNMYIPTITKQFLQITPASLPSSWILKTLLGSLLETQFERAASSCSKLGSFCTWWGGWYIYRNWGRERERWFSYRIVGNKVTRWGGVEDTNTALKYLHQASVVHQISC